MHNHDMYREDWPTFLVPRHIVACLVVVLGILTACSQPPEPPLRIGTSFWPGYEPLHLAKSLGLYDDYRVKLIELVNASDVLHAMRTRNLEGAVLTLDEALTLIQDGIDLRVILVMDVSNGGDVLLAKPEIKTLAGLRGKRVAVEDTAVGAILLDAALEAAGLTVADIEVVACTVDRHEDCYSSANAVVTFEPVRTRLLNQGARLLFDSSQIPGRIVDVLVVHAEITETHPESLQYLLGGYFQALEHLQHQPDDAARRMAVRLGITAAEMLASYDGISLPGLSGNKTLFAEGPESLQTTVADLAHYMLEKKLLSEVISVENFIDGSFLAD